jgi:hypothetical protein
MIMTTAGGGGLLLAGFTQHPVHLHVWKEYIVDV